MKIQQNSLFLREQDYIVQINVKGMYDDFFVQQTTIRKKLVLLNQGQKFRKEKKVNIVIK